MNRLLSKLLILIGVSCTIARADDPPATQPAVAIPATTPITMHMTSVHPRDALDELKKQTGVSVSFWPDNLWEQNQGPGNNPPTSIDVDVDQQPFWVVLDKICEASHLTPTYMGRHELTLQWHGPGQSTTSNRPTSASPTALATITEIHRNHTVSFNSADQTPQKNCGVGMEIYLDPRLRTLTYDPQVHIETADDESGHSIAVAAPAAGQPNMQNINCRWLLQGISIPLDYDPQVSHKLAVLKGSVHVSVASEVDTLQIDDVANAQGISKTLGGMGVSIDDVKLDEHSFSMKFILERDDMPEDQWRQVQQSFFGAIHLESAEGKTINVGGGGGGDNKKLQYTLSMNYNSDADKPAKLTWEVPAKLDEVDLPFEFHDLTLP